MILERSQEEYENWKNQMYAYEKNKRTKKPFGKEFVPNSEKVSGSEIKVKQKQFNPVLQKFDDPILESSHQHKEEMLRNNSLASHFKNAGRNNRQYDIITLHGQQLEQCHSSRSFTNRKDLETVRYIHNPINNKAMPKFYYQRKRIQVKPERQFRYQGPEIREFDIVKCMHREKNDQKMETQLKERDQKIYDKYDKTHQGYNAVVGRYYNKDKQKQYEQKLATSQIQYGSDYSRRFPPTYRSREPLILDRTQPPTQPLLALDRKQANAKQRFKLKYIIEEQYRQRNIEDFQRKQAKRINRVHNSHALQKIGKEFIYDNPKRYDQGRQFTKKHLKQRWEKQSNYCRSEGASNQGGPPISIKSGGFI